MYFKQVMIHYFRAFKSVFGWKKYSDKCATCTHSVDKRITNTENKCIFDNIKMYKYYCEYENTVDLEGQHMMPVGCIASPQNVPNIRTPPSM